MLLAQEGWKGRLLLVPELVPRCPGDTGGVGTWLCCSFPCALTMELPSRAQSSPRNSSSFGFVFCWAEV